MKPQTRGWVFINQHIFKICLAERKGPNTLPETGGFGLGGA